MKILLLVSFVLLLNYNVSPQIIINSRQHNAAATLPLTGNLIANGDFEETPLSSHNIQVSSADDSQKWWAAWSTGGACTNQIPGWTVSTNPDAYGAVGPVTATGEFGNMANDRTCGVLQYLSGSPAAAISGVNVAAALSGSNMLYMGLGEGWLTSAPTPDYNSTTGEIFAPGSQTLTLGGTTPLYIEQSVNVTNGQSYSFEFGITGEADERDGFIRLDIGADIFWYIVPGTELMNQPSLQRFYRIDFTATETGPLLIRFTNYGHPISGAPYGLANWDSFYGGPGIIGNEAFLDRVVLIPSDPLPLTMGTITAREEGGTNTIRWNTYHETLLDRFVIERSSDAMTWSAIGEVAARNEDNSSYLYRDPMNSINAKTYYRLKIVDGDGRITYSSIVTLAGALQYDAHIYAVSGKAFIKIDSKKPEQLSITVYSVSGHKLGLSRRSIFPGTNVFELNDLGALPRGVYIVQLTNQSRSATVTQRLLLQ